MRPGKWLMMANSLRKFVLALYRGDLRTVSGVLILTAVAVILSTLWEHYYTNRGLAQKPQVPTLLEDGTQESWSPPTPEDGTRVVNRRPSAAPSEEDPRA